MTGLAIGGSTSRLKFGHRGANHPVQDLRTGRVYITSQNHGFQVDGDSIPEAQGFTVSHVNLNDGSVEGLDPPRVAPLHGAVPPRGQPRAPGQPVPLRPLRGRPGGTAPWRTPEAPLPAPLAAYTRSDQGGKPRPPSRPRCSSSAPARSSSGRRRSSTTPGRRPAGRCARRACTTVLVNSNPATIMTDEDIADVVYIEPLTVEVVERIIARERPDGLLPTLGGQTGLNLAVALADAGVLETLQRAPARHAARDDPQGRGPRAVPRAAASSSASRCPSSRSCTTLEEAEAVARAHRPARSSSGPPTRSAAPAAASRTPSRSTRRASSRAASPPARSRRCCVERSPARLERGRVRGDARRRRQLHHRLQHGELRPDGRPHRRQHRRRAQPDADRQGVPDAPLGGAEDHPRPGHRGRLQHPVRLAPAETSCGTPIRRAAAVLRHRGQPPRLALAPPWPRKATGYPIARVAAKIAVGKTLDEIPNAVTGEDDGRLRAGARLLRGEDPALALRQVPVRRPHASARR